MSSTIETVTIQNTVYQVVKTDDCRNLPRLRAEMDKAGIADSLILQRPKGRKAFFAHRYHNGHITIVAAA